VCAPEVWTLTREKLQQKLTCETATLAA